MNAESWKEVKYEDDLCVVNNKKQKNNKIIVC